MNRPTRGLSENQQRVGASFAAGLAVLILVSPLCWLGARRSADVARNETRILAETRVADALLSMRTDEFEDPPNVWVVDHVDEWSSPLGDTWTQPPLLSLADLAFAGPNTREYDFEGKWLATAESIGGNQVLVAVIERDAQDSTIASAQRAWAVGAALAAIAAGGVAWLVLGRMRAPVTRAHAVNRDFIADAAHELRTPLAVIQASASHALARERPSDAYRESLEEILGATERAGDSVGELLEFARLEAGQATLRFAPLRLDLLVEEVASSIRIDGVSVEAVAGEAVVVEADFNLLRQVVDNITRNAAARSNKVTLTTALGSAAARIEIADDGPGFDPGVIDHVFERFRRGDRSGSVGLGMAIARTVVEMHGGSCEATNLPETEPGEPSGALVVVTIPYRQ